MSTPRAIVVGAGVGGLACAIDLSVRGIAVTIVEAASMPGGKIATVPVAGRAIDCGPTVLTMRWVFDRLFAEAGAAFDRALVLHPAACLARHAWSATEQLDLFADRDRSAEAIARFSSPREAHRYRDFCDQARAVFEGLRDTFMDAPLPGPSELVWRMGIGGVGALMRASPFADLWTALSRAFDDPRLRQLFGRYATYCGASPFLAPSTLMLIAHAEQEGVWLVEGGMIRLAEALADLARARGAELRCDSPVAEIAMQGGRASGVRLADGTRLHADIVVLNADRTALATGLFGTEVAAAAGIVPMTQRSLSAITFSGVGVADGFTLARHTVFFSRDYRQEFDSLFGQGALPHDPTVYVCAQDRDDRGRRTGEDGDDRSERLFVLVNAPARGDELPFTDEEIGACETRIRDQLARCGLTLTMTERSIATPQDFARRFPATGGALYGSATHGAMATFARPSSRTRLPGLYLAGGSVHPGPGVPMAALSGRLAARAIAADYPSTVRSRPAATRGGISTR